MTMQIGDHFRHKRHNYSIVATSNPIQFNPLDYGIKPQECCTACWNGYWCDYQVSNERMMLKDLYIHSEDDYYPEINNVSAKENRKRFGGHHLYENLNIFMKYTGKVLIGKDFLRGYYLYTNTRDEEPWAYEVLEEFIFDNGKLVKTVDHSEIAKKLRIEFTELDNIIKRENRSITRSDIREYFSLEMKDKAWWIE